MRLKCASAGAGVEQALQPHAAEDQAPRRRAQHDHSDRRPRAERIAAEVVIGEAEMRDQREAVAREHVGRIGRGIVRLGAVRRARAGRA